MTWILPRSITFPSAQDTAALISDCDEQSQVCARSLLLRSKVSPARTWSLKWKRDSWTQHLSGRILKPSHTESFEDWWTSCLAATRASHLVPQDSDEAKTTHDISGRGLQMELLPCDQVSASLKTSKDISAWGCPTLSKTWQEWVTEQRGAYSARLKSARLTSESAFSSWPTVTTAEAGKISNRRNYGQIGLSNHPAIHGQITRGPLVKDRAGQEKQWPTPTAQETQDQGTNWELLAKLDKGGRILRRIASMALSGPAAQANPSLTGSRLESWATPRAGKTTDENPETWVKRKEKGDVATMPLTAQVKVDWPTPRTQMTRPGESRGETTEVSLFGSKTTQLDKANIEERVAICEGVKQAKLNPRWVETLMGLPIGWVMPSCSRPQTIVPTSCDCLETESSQLQQNEPSES